ncbi:putative YTH domain-containing protein [Helianthus annuus]|uniref:YTH domain-containing family protein n=1 Tax=Helianthus annuus TaxID=4232 RepID=A0A251UAQ0_HELAN|nr:YTH domain-containing protein ECT4 [Helianthus annuus]KAF5797384.1 putative YTH domain-containing protein [Helianthus annuus]KAJ0562088.1 putative YTH domain-containing protein [Helianthus annuus]
MVTVAPPTDDAAALLKNLSLDSQAKSLEVSDPVKKTSVDTGNGQIKPSNKVVTPLASDVMDPSLAYYPNGYPSTAYYYGGYDGTAIDWDDLANGVYGYGYAPYGSYSQHYQYPSAYFQPPTSTGGPYPATVTPSKDGTTAPAVTDQKPLATDATKGSVGNGVGSKGNNGPEPVKPVVNQNSAAKTNGLYGTGAQNSYYGVYSSVPWLNGTMSSDPQTKNNGVASKSQNHLMGPNSVYSNKFYGQFGNAYGSCYGYGTNGYDYQNNGRGWLSVDNKFKPRVRANGYFGYNNDSSDGLNELNRGPRSRTIKNQKPLTPITTAVKGQEDIAVSLSPTDGIKDESKEVKEVNVTPDREQYNKTEFPETYEDAKFFIIKSYSEDDVHKSIKYNVWASTQNGNKKLDAAYREAQQKSEACPIFLFFSVNTSGQFVGVAEMVGPVDFNKSLEYWQQDKWIGCFPVKWHIVKDLPNSLLKHIILEYNENKPVTNSRDTQEVKLAQGLQVIKVFKEHASKQCILDDFEFYEDRQKKIQQKKAKQQQFQKQSWEGKLVTDKKIKGAENEVLKSDDGSDVVKEVKLVNNVQDVAAKPDEVEVVVNGVANAC